MRSKEALPSSPVWLLAIRPRTLPASITPVIVGSAAACADGHFKLLPAIAALACSLLLQVGVNLANDYFDFVSGFDTEERVGPTRVTQSGLILPYKVRNAMFFTFFIAACIGIYLIIVAGLPIFAAGVASIITALMYSGGPYPLASHGLGDLFVFIFFGLVAVCGTCYVQTLHITLLAVMASIPIGLLITAILVVNNLRDIGTDAKVNKRTLAVMLGERATRMEFIILIISSYIMAVLLWVVGRSSLWMLLPLISVPLAWSTARVVIIQTGSALNEALALTARLSLVYGVLLAVGIVLSSI
jgi:1,4-dihydroxy-2-naphthoate polyprenyltransferase